MVIVTILIYGALTIQRNKDWKSNYTLFESGVVSSPNSTRTHAALANELHQQAKVNTSLSEKSAMMQRAVEEYKKSEALYPSNPFTLYNLAVLYQEMGDTLASIAQYRKELSYRPDGRNAGLNLAVLYGYTGKLDSAAYLLKNILQKNPNDRSALTNITAVYLNKKDFEAARVYAEQAIHVAPEDAINFMNMANLEYNLGKKDSADYYYAQYKAAGGQ